MVEKYINRDLIKKLQGKDIYVDFEKGNYFPIQFGGWGYCKYSICCERDTLSDMCDECICDPDIGCGGIYKPL